MWIVEPRDLALRVGEDEVLVLHHRVGWQAAFRLTQRHRTPARVKTEAQLRRAGHEGLEEVALAGWKDVVMVGRERAAGEQELGHRRSRRRPHGLGVDPRPDRIYRA